MKEKIDITEYSKEIAQALSKGILLNTQSEKFNSMVVSWGAPGIIWGKKSFTVYVRQSRFTKKQLDAKPAFTISIPLDGVNPTIAKVCGSLSGHDIDKVKEANLSLVDAEVNGVPGIKEYPLTIECQLLFAQDMPIDKVAERVRDANYPQDVDSSFSGSNRDGHTMYIGEIVAAYIIK